MWFPLPKHNFVHSDDDSVRSWVTAPKLNLMDDATSGAVYTVPNASHQFTQHLERGTRNGIS